MESEEPEPDMPTSFEVMEGEISEPDTPWRRKKDKDMSKGKEVRMSSDPFLDMVGGLRSDLNNASHHFGRMVETMEREAKVQEEASQKDPMQVMQEKAVNELTRLGFTGSELLKAAAVFVKVPNEMTMLFALPETLRREFIQNMLADEAQRKM